jgi:hypothetical protein
MQQARGSQSGEGRARCCAACLVQDRNANATATSRAATLPSGSPRPLPTAYCPLLQVSTLRPGRCR